MADKELHSGFDRFKHDTSTQTATDARQAVIDALQTLGILPLPEGACGKWKVEAPLIDFIPGLPAFHVTQLPMGLLDASIASHPKFEFLLRAFARAREGDRILVNSLYELESHVYDTMQTNGFPIYHVGPIFDTQSAGRTQYGKSKRVPGVA